MTFPTYEEWGEKVAEQVTDVYLINGRTIREWIEILSDELTMLDKIRAEIMQLDYNLESVDYDHNDMAMTEEVHMICQEEVLQIIDRYRTESEDKE